MSDLQALVPITSCIIGTDPVQAVSARDLHAFLEVQSEFRNWIKNRIEQYQFVQGSDFIAGNFLPGSERIDYYISIDMAKEISMVERNEKGKEARQYFIACEKRARGEGMTTGDLLVQMAITYREHERRILSIEVEQAETKQKIAELVGGEDYATAKGFARTNGLRADREFLNQLGRRASAMCRQRGLSPGKVGDEVWGEVNSYPREILAAAYSELTNP